MRPFKILTVVLLFSCNSPDRHSNTGTEQAKVSNFDTLPNGQRLLDNLDSAIKLYYKEVVGSDTLKGGYITCYGIDDSMRYFYLRQGDTLHLLNKSTKHVSPWSLGTLERDFTSFFITRVDHGNGCPSSYQIFDKKTGKNILGDKVEALDFKYSGNTLFMLYDNSNESKTPDCITLFNVSTKKTENFKLPDDIPEFYDIQIGRLTKNSLKIIYSSYASSYNQGEKTRTYSR